MEDVTLVLVPEVELVIDKVDELAVVEVAVVTVAVVAVAVVAVVEVSVVTVAVVTVVDVEVAEVKVAEVDVEDVEDVVRVELDVCEVVVVLVFSVKLSYISLRIIIKLDGES